MIVLQKRNERAQQINIPACISCYLGVTEPALFGVNMKYVFPLVCGMIGSACAAMISIGTGVTAISIGVGGLPGILSIFPEYWVNFLLAMLTAIIVPFVLTIVVGSRKLGREERGLVTAGVPAEPETTAETASQTPAQTTTEQADNVLTAIADGRVIPLSDVPDEVFSQGVMGDGVAFEPTGDTIYAPADAEITVVMADTKHACGLRMNDGTELLIHVGVDTVDMGGDGFTLHVSEGDKVRRGQALITFDANKIAAAGHPTTTMLIVTDPGAHSLVTHTGRDGKHGETPVAELG